MYKKKPQIPRKGLGVFFEVTNISFSLELIYKNFCYYYTLNYYFYFYLVGAEALDIKDKMWPKLWDFSSSDIRLKDVLYNPAAVDSSIISITDSTGLSHEKHAPNLSTESEVKASLRAIHVARRHIFLGDMSTEVLLTFLDFTKWLYSYFSNYNDLKANNAAKVDILVFFCETVLRKNGENYKSHRAYLDFDEIERLASPIVQKLKAKALRDHPSSYSKKSDSVSASGKSDSFSTPSKPAPSRDPRADPSKPKGYRFMVSKEAIAALGKRLCRNYNTEGSGTEGSACSNTKKGAGCESKSGTKYTHACNFKYDGSGQDGTFCNEKHPRYKHK